jgi:hypothetical protein
LKSKKIWYHLAHTSDTTSKTLLDEFLIEIRPVRQDHIGKGALVLVVAVGLERDFFPEDKGRGGMLGPS